MSVIFLLREANIKLLGYHEWTETSLPLPWTPHRALPPAASTARPLPSSLKLVQEGWCGLTASMLQSWHQMWHQQEPRQDPLGGVRKMGLVHNSQKFHGPSSVCPHPHSPWPIACDPRLSRWVQQTCWPTDHRAFSASKLATQTSAYCVLGKWIWIWGFSDMNIKNYISAQWIHRQFHCSSSIRRNYRKVQKKRTLPAFSFDVACVPPTATEGLSTNSCPQLWFQGRACNPIRAVCQDF